MLWASTSTKDPAYPDTKSIEALIGPNTINTLPVETLNAYRNHGHPQQSLDQNVSESYRKLGDSFSIGIDLNVITQWLEDDRAEKFTEASYRLMASIKEKQTVVQDAYIS
jgi:transaldolase